MNINVEKAHEMGNEMLHEVVRICDENELLYYAAYGTVLGAVRHNASIPWDSDIDIFVPESGMEEFIAVMKEQLPNKYWIHDKTNGNHPRCFARIGLAGYKTEAFHIDVFRLSGAPERVFEQKKFVRNGRLLFIAWKAKAVDADYYYKSRKMMRIKAKLLKTLLLPIPIMSIVTAIDRLCTKYDYEESRVVGCPMEGSVKYLFDKGIFGEGVKLDYSGIQLRVPQDYDGFLEQVYGDYMAYPPKEEQEAGLKRILVIREL